MSIYGNGTRLPMWSSIEDEDPWAGGNKQYCRWIHREVQRPPRKPHGVPLSRQQPRSTSATRQSLREWLNKRVTKPLQKTQNGFNGVKMFCLRYKMQ
jgi:hypothetical protein